MREVTQAWWVGEAIDDRVSSVIACTAGLGAGKTHGGCQWHHDRVRQNYESKFSAFMEPTYQKVMDTAIPTYQKVLYEMGRAEDWHYKIVKSPHPKLIYKDQRVNHEVHFLSAENPDRIAGVEYSHALEDEAGVNDVNSRRNLRTRLFRDPQAIAPQFMVIGAPQGVNEFAEEFDSETLPGWNTDHSRDHYTETEEEGIKIRKRRFIIWTDDNPFKNPRYIAELMATYGHNPFLIQSYRYGRFCPLTEKAAYANYSPQKHNTEAFKIDPMLPVNLCWDFNVVPLAWVSIQGFNLDYPRRRVHVALKEANQGANNLDDSCIEFAIKHPRELFRDTPIYIYGDPSGHSDSWKTTRSDFENIKLLLTELGYRNVIVKAHKAHPSEGTAVDAMNRLFLNNILLVHMDCVMFRKGLMATQWKDGVRKIDKPKGETHTHHPEAVKNWAWQERKNLLLNADKIYGKN